MTSYTYGTTPADFVESPSAETSGQTYRPDAGLVLTVRDADTLGTVTGLTDTDGTSITEVTTEEYGYFSFKCDSPIVQVSADGGTTWKTLFGLEALQTAVAGGTAEATAETALTTATAAQTTATAAAAAAAAAQATADEALSGSGTDTAGGYGPNYVASATTPEAIRTAVLASGGTVADTSAANVAIQAALDTYGTVFLLPGAYTIAATISLATEGRALYGSGAKNTTLTAAATVSGSMISITAGNCIVREIGLVGGSAASGTAGISAAVTSTSGFWTGSEACVRISGVTVKAVPGVGVSMTGTYNRDAKLHDIHVANAGSYGFYLNCPDGTGTQLVAGSSGADGLFCDTSSANWKLVGCKMWYSDGDGFRFLTGPRHTVVGCEAQDNQYAGFRVNTSEMVLSGCLADSNSYDGTTTLTNVHSGFEIGRTSAGATSGGWDIAITGCQSYDKNESSRGYCQRSGFRLRTGIRGLTLTGCTTGDPSSTHHNVTSGIEWDTATDQTNASNAVASVSHRVAQYSSSGTGTSTAGGLVTAYADTVSASTYTVSASNGAVQTLTLSADTTITLGTVDDGSAAEVVVRLVQDSTGGRTVSWGTGAVFPSGTPTIAAGASASTRLVLTRVGTETAWTVDEYAADEPEPISGVKLAPGYWYGASPARAGTGSTTQGVGTLKVTPFWVSEDCTIDTLAVRVGTAGSSDSTMCVVVYGDNGLGAPGALLAAEEVSTASTGAITATLTTPLALSAGLYHFGAGIMVATTAPSVYVNDVANLQVRSTSADGALGSQMGYTTTGVTSIDAVPETWASATTSGSSPRVAFHLSA